MPEGSAPHRRGALTGVLLRFVSCGLVSLSGGLLWRLTLAPHRVGVGSALLGILCLLLGFIVGGLGWYIHDLRLRARRPDAIDDERLVFSFVVFAVVPMAVLVLVAVVWTGSLIAGR
ncbi:MAG: hypothetical protein NVSMB29_16250 [Candidatus Dormibacteria bacterium]